MEIYLNLTWTLIINDLQNGWIEISFVFCNDISLKILSDYLI